MPELLGLKLPGAGEISGVGGGAGVARGLSLATRGCDEVSDPSAGVITGAPKTSWPSPFPKHITLGSCTVGSLCACPSCLSISNSTTWNKGPGAFVFFVFSDRDKK